MSQYLYPAIFQPEGSAYNVTFPDLPDCFTCGDDLTDAMRMAQDVLADVLAEHEQTGEPFATASPLHALAVPDGCLASLVLADTDTWRCDHATRAVKRHSPSPSSSTKPPKPAM